MTKQQAINILNGLEQSLDDYCELNDEGKAAFRMAITALESFGNSEQLPSAQPDAPDANVGDTISRQAAIDALWKALYGYEDKTEKQFQESEDLDVGDWIEHRIFVQNMNDIDRQTILKLPSAQPETEWNNHTVACLLAELFGDTCACNFNGIDGWLPEKCEVIDSCPNPVGVACWEQFLTHRAERRTG